MMENLNNQRCDAMEMLGQGQAEEPERLNQVHANLAQATSGRCDGAAAEVSSPAIKSEKHFVGEEGEVDFLPGPDQLENLDRPLSSPELSGQPEACSPEDPVILQEKQPLHLAWRDRRTKLMRKLIHPWDYLLWFTNASAKHRSAEPFRRLELLLNNLESMLTHFKIFTDSVSSVVEDSSCSALDQESGSLIRLRENATLLLSGKPSPPTSYLLLGEPEILEGEFERCHKLLTSMFDISNPLKGEAVALEDDDCDDEAWPAEGFQQIMEDLFLKKENHQSEHFLYEVAPQEYATDDEEQRATTRKATRNRRRKKKSSSNNSLHHKQEEEPKSDVGEDEQDLSEDTGNELVQTINGRRVIKRAMAPYLYRPEFRITEDEFHEVMAKGRPYTCPSCHRIFKDKRVFMTHLRVRCTGVPLEGIAPMWKFEDGRFRCLHPGCDYKVLHKQTLYRHHQREHLPEDARLPYKCSQCDKSFLIKNLLSVHFKEFHQEKQKKCCEICGQSVTTNTQLKLHMRGHTGEKPFKCSYCDYRGVNLSSVRKHTMLKHETHMLKMHFCEICGKEFKLKSNLKEHIATHSDQRTFLCKLCGKCLKNDSGYRKHMVFVHRIKHTCEMCKKDYSTIVGLNLHMKKVHGIYS